MANTKPQIQSTNEVSIISLAFSDSRIPEFKKTSNKPFILFGADDKYPDDLLNLYNKSAKHNAIINGKVNYIFGGGLKAETPGTAAETWIKCANRSGETLDEIAKKTVVDIEVFGGFYWQIIKSRLGEVTEIYHIEFRKVRTNEDNSMFFYKYNWSDRNEKIKEIKAFYPSDKTTDTSIYFFSEYRPGTEVYCLPGYVGSINYIESDIEVSKHTLTNAKTGFSASKHISLFNGTPTEEQKRDITRHYENRLTGSEGKKLIISYNQDPNKKPVIDDLGASDITKEDFSHIDNLISDNIYAGHNITSPMLFGIKEAGQLGGKNELRISFEIFKKTYATNKQVQLEKVINNFAEIKGIQSKFKFIDIDPVGVEFTDVTLLQAAPRSWLLEQLGIDTTVYTDDPIGAKNADVNSLPPAQQPGEQAMVNDNLKNLTGRQQQAINRIVRMYENGKIKREMAAHQLKNGFGLSDEDVVAYLGKEGETFGKEYTEEEVADMFEEAGTTREEFTVLKSKKVLFESDKEATDFELNFFETKAFEFRDTVSAMESKILTVISKNKNADDQSIADALGLDVSVVSDKIKELEDKDYIKTQITNDGESEIITRELTKPLSEITKNIKTELPQIFIKYSYEKDPKADGPIIIPTSRPFCRKMVQLDRFYSRVEIEKISERLGYSVWDRRGGFWNNNGDIQKSCRHRWVTNVVIKKKSSSFGGPGSGRHPGGGTVNISGASGDTATMMNTVVHEEAGKLGLTQDIHVAVGTSGKLKGFAQAGVSFGSKPDSEGRYFFEPKISLIHKNDEESGKNLRHELMHLHQAETKKMYFKGGHFYWNGEKHTSVKEYNTIVKGMTKSKTKDQYDKAIQKYRGLPWESEADEYAGT